MPFELPKLSYDYDELEPYIDSKTMEIHHTKHHLGYTQKLNKALENNPEYYKQTIENILINIKDVPEEIGQAVINNGGGYHNHLLFWENMTPERDTKPSTALEKSIIDTFESLENFKKQFQNAAETKFGSGWAWLVIGRNKELEILQTSNQDSPLSIGYKPLLCIDIWEHAYYLKYQNRRAEYIENWMNIINWDSVSKRYDTVDYK